MSKTNEILDWEDSDKHQKKRWYGIVGIIMVWLLLFSNFQHAIISFSALELVFIVALVIITITYFVKNRIGVILGLFYLLFFSFSFGIFPMKYDAQITIGLGALELSFNRIFLPICMVHLIANWKILRPELDKFLGRDGQSVESNKIGKISGFRRRFDKKSNSELKEIMKNEGLVREARRAAELILDERNEMKTE